MSESPLVSPRPEQDPLIGQTVSGRYRVLSLLGQGGMGKVFRAQQVPLGRPVALKVLNARGVDPEFYRRFFQEAAILAKLQSRHTVAIYDYGRDGDLYFIAMELITGEPLDRVLHATGPLSVERALVIAQEVCRSLREAHAQGVIHRDLKPANVMLTLSEDGQELAKVLDFGLAKRLDGASTEDTQSDTVPGSPKYMAPEVIRQHPIDGRADMYGVGVMLYHMLTGVVPFDHDNPMDILVAHLQQTPRPFIEANPAVEVPKALEEIVMRCLAKTPDERFTDMHELLDALRVLGASLLGSHGERSMAGLSMAPEPNTSSGVRATSTSSVPSLRLESAEQAAARSAIDRPPSRMARGAWVAGVLGALVLALVAVWSATRKPTPAISEEAGPMSPPVPTAQPNSPSAGPAAGAETRAAASTAANDLKAATVPVALPRVKLRVTSEPEGASVLVRGKWMGTTPTSFEWRDAEAVQGGKLTITLKLDGYQPAVLQRTIDAAELDLTSVLTPLPAQSDLRALAARAHALEAAPTPEAPPVLKIKPSQPEAADKASEPAAPTQDTVPVSGQP